MHGLADYIKTELPYWPVWINRFFLTGNIFGSMVYGRAYRKLSEHSDVVSPEEHLVNMVNYAIRKVPYYRKKYGNLVIRDKNDFEQKIGFIDKNEVMTNWEDFLSDDIDWSRVRVGTTGGTSGKPLKLVEPLNRYVHSLVYLHRYWFRFGWRYDTVGVFRNHRIPSERDYLISPVLKEVIFDSFRLNEVYARRCRDVLIRYRIRFIHAYPSAFYQFCKLCVRQGLELDFIQCAFLASEGVTPEQYAFFDDLGIQISSFFGHSEKLIFAGNGPQTRFYDVEENYGYCELIGEDGEVIREPGRQGELTGTTFMNSQFPLIRYRTGDYSQWVGETPSKDGQRILNIIQGRWNHNLIYRIDGTTVSITALNLHSDIYQHIDGIQYIQDVYGKLEVDIIKNDGFSDSDECMLKNLFGRAMLGDDNVHIRYVDTLRIEPNGKFLPLLSNIRREETLVDEQLYRQYEQKPVR